ncbi:chordopoxvirus fusion protein [Thermodesulfovibrio hydrogeniphilus]
MVSVQFYRKIEKLPEDFREIFLDLIEEVAKTVTKEDFRELKDTVAEIGKSLNELAEAQKKSEERLTRLEKVVEELAEAQKKSEERLTRLEKTVEELAEAQNRAEQRLGRLEQVVEELAEAQKKTEDELAKLVQEHRKTREQVGNLINLHGFLLEDRAYKALPQLLERDFGAKVLEPFKRTFVSLSKGKEIELNIIGKVEIKEKSFWVLGECKTQLKKSDITEFEKKLQSLEKIFGKNFIKILVTAQTINSEVIKFAEQRGFKLYFSYEFPI